MAESSSPEETLKLAQVASAWVESKKIMLTDALRTYIMGQGPVDRKIFHLERLSKAAESGMFDPDNVLMRDLQFSQFMQLARKDGDYSPTSEIYARFQKLPRFQPQLPEEAALDDAQRKEAARAAYEATLFVKLVREFAASSDRPIVIVGNNRYGELFVVEPARKYFPENVVINNARVSSSEYHRNTEDVPQPFKPEDMERMLGLEPHFVIVDGASEGSYQTTRFSTAQLAYINLFILVNDLRSGHAEWEPDLSTLASEHLRLVRGSMSYRKARTDLTGFVKPGPLFSVAQWAPHLEEKVTYHDVPAARRPLTMPPEQQMLVVAMPLYRGKFDGVPSGIASMLEGTSPSYWDDPDQYATGKIVIGFGATGVEKQKEGKDVKQIIKSAQEYMERAIGTYIERL